MEYPFIKKAQQEPDLKDFLEYLKKPLSTLEELLKRYQNLDINKKNITSNMALYLRIDKILNKVLPSMVDNFCNFSFEYRNQHIIEQKGKKSYTAKDLLLNNLSQLIDEIHDLEDDFNEQNRFEMLAQKNYLSNFSTEPSLELANQFNYKKYRFEQPYLKTIFKKAVDQPVKKEPVEDSDDDIESSKENWWAVGGLATVLVGLLVVKAMVEPPMLTYTYLNNNFLQNITELDKNISSMKGTDYHFINNSYLLGSTFLTKDLFKKVNSQGSDALIVKPANIHKPDDSYSIEFNLGPGFGKYGGQREKDCEKISSMADFKPFSSIYGQFINQESFISQCSYHPSEPVHIKLVKVVQ